MEETTIQYPRRRLIRSILRSLIGMALGMLGDFTVEGKENLDKGGPLLVVANHFHFLDPVVLIRAVQWPLEFVGGAQTPNAPSALSWLTSLYGVIPTYRGTGARSTIKTSELILAQKGVLAIFPEGGKLGTGVAACPPGYCLPCHANEHTPVAYWH